MNLLLRVCESRTSHVSIDRFAFCSDFFARISSHVRRWISKRRRRSVFIVELCESYYANNRRQTRDELVVMTREATKDEMSFLNMSLACKRTFLAYDDVTILLFLRLSFSQDWLWIASCDDRNVLRSRVVCARLIDSTWLRWLWNNLDIALCNVNSSMKNIREELTLVCWCLFLRNVNEIARSVLFAK
jgi:hypothetical protein